MIVVISHAADPHAEAVTGRLRADGREVVLLDLAELPGRATLTFDYDTPERPAVEYRLDGGSAIALHRARSVWWRRPQAVDLSGVTDPDTRLFTANEWNEAVNGLWTLLPAPWMNDPARDERASRKALQLRLAAQAGLRVPRTMITSDPDRARSFIDAQGPGGTIHKTFSCTHAVWRETRMVRPQDLDVLDSVRVAPVIFQEHVPAEADLRITVIGDRIFAAAIRPRRDDDRVDFRMRLGASDTEATTLPDDIAHRLLGLMRTLGLAYGAIDMRRTPAGEHVFFEVNTAGEFLFIETRTGQPITQALADWLATPASPRAPGVQ